MKTKERIDQAYKRIKELFLLINDWTRGVKETNSEYLEIKKRKQEMDISLIGYGLRKVV